MQISPLSVIIVTLYLPVSCTPGTYNIYDDNICVRCPMGTYQEDYGQTSCHSCPPNTFTVEDMAKNQSDCVGKNLFHCLLLNMYVINKVVE